MHWISFFPGLGHTAGQLLAIAAMGHAMGLDDMALSDDPEDVTLLTAHSRPSSWQPEFSYHESVVYVCTYMPFSRLRITSP